MVNFALRRFAAAIPQLLPTFRLVAPTWLNQYPAFCQYQDVRDFKILGPVRAKPVFAADGTLICGTSSESYRAWTCWIETTPDRGQTWRKHGPITVPKHPRGIIQPTVLVGEGGAMFFLARSSGLGHVVRASSKDGGINWSPTVPIAVPNPNAGIDAIRLHDGRVALLYNHSATKRTPLRIAVSKDEGKTFTPMVTLEDQPGEYSYPAMILASDGQIHCTYTWQRKRVKHVLVDPRLLAESKIK